MHPAVLVGTDPAVLRDIILYRNRYLLFEGDPAGLTRPSAQKWVFLTGGCAAFEKILLATDFSAFAKMMLDCIAGFPGTREVIFFDVAEKAVSPIGGGDRRHLPPGRIRTYQGTETLSKT